LLYRLEGRFIKDKEIKSFIMSRISEDTKKLLKEDILSILYEKHPLPLFTRDISREMRRDGEFTLKLLKELEENGLVKSLSFDSRRRTYIRRKKWKIPQDVVDAML